MISRAETIPQNHKKIAIYTRNTSWTQPKGYRIHRDIQVLKNKCERAGLRINKTYFDPSSTSDSHRSYVLVEMLKDAFCGCFNTLVIWDVFTLHHDGEVLQKIERTLAEYGVEICSLREHIDTSTDEGLKVFECMCKLFDTEHFTLSAMQGIPLSQVARWLIEDEKKKGGERNGELCETARRPV